MEAPEFLRRFGLSLVSVIIVGCAYPLPVFEYELSAHAALTSAIVDVYNKGNAALTISDAHRFAMVRATGSSGYSAAISW